MIRDIICIQIKTSSSQDHDTSTLSNDLFLFALLKTSRGDGSAHSKYVNITSYDEVSQALSNEAGYHKIGPLNKKILTYVRPGFK